MDLKLLESVKRIISSGYNKYPHIKFRVFDEGSKIVNPMEGKFFIKGSDNFNSKFAFRIKLEKSIDTIYMKIYSRYGDFDHVGNLFVLIDHLSYYGYNTLGIKREALLNEYVSSFIEELGYISNKSEFEEVIQFINMHRIHENILHIWLRVSITRAYIQGVS